MKLAKLYVLAEITYDDETQATVLSVIDERSRRTVPKRYFPGVPSVQVIYS